MARYFAAELLGLGGLGGLNLGNFSALALGNIFDDIFGKLPPIEVIPLCRTDHTWLVVVVARCGRHLRSCKMLAKIQLL